MTPDYGDYAAQFQKVMQSLQTLKDLQGEVDRITYGVYHPYEIPEEADSEDVAQIVSHLRE